MSYQSQYEELRRRCRAFNDYCGVNCETCDCWPEGLIKQIEDEVDEYHKRKTNMSIGLQIICTQCLKSVYIGTMNSMTDENPERTAAFLWKHRMHDMTTVDESHPSYYEWAEREEEQVDANGNIIS